LLLRNWSRSRSGSLLTFLAFLGRSGRSRSRSGGSLNGDLLLLLVFLNELGSVKRRNLILIQLDSKLQRVLLMLRLGHFNMVSSEECGHSIY
jgi:hypothetical protein